jgi:hypothetical protein
LWSSTCGALPGVLTATWFDKMIIQALPKSGGIHIILAQKFDGAVPANVKLRLSLQPRTVNTTNIW